MPSSYRERDREQNSVTVVVIPHHGASLFQWRLPRYVWMILLFVMGSIVGSALWILSLHIQYSSELSRLHAELDANKRVALELGKGQDAVVRVARLELELRKMLSYKSEKSLLNSDNVGGPSEEDVQNLTLMLEHQPEMAAEKASVDMESLVASAEAREKSFDEIRKYVDHKRSMLAAKPTAWPVHGWISSGFGSRVNPLSGEPGFHTGVDIANDIGTPVHATADGRVAFAGWEGGYGKLVVVEHGQGFSTYYGHLSEIKATVGQMVRRGTTVGLMGQTGDATGPHVHYEIRVYGAAVDPTKYMEE
jgi:murein DD-endopeptidase MepM/ murein hydrolase activator NlpD